jgi:hypothetical protein
MRPRQNKLHPVVRLAAAGLLPVWLLAVAHCSADCQDACCGSEHAPPAAAADAGTHHSDQHDDCFCDSLHSVCPVSPAAAFVKPDFGLAAILNFVSAAQPLAGTPPEARVPRQQPDFKWVFTPEVCLGPAFHSLAPPVPA